MRIRSVFTVCRAITPVAPAAFVIGLGLIVASTLAPVRAQPSMLGVTDAASDSQPTEAPATFAARLSRAHQQAMGNAQALATYVERNAIALNMIVVRLHIDAIGSSLDDAIYLAKALIAQQEDAASKERFMRVAKRDTQAKVTFKRLLGMLRGSSVTAPQIAMLATQIHQEVRAADQALRELPAPQPPISVAVSQ